jgi:hypothetical protein
MTEREYIDATNLAKLRAAKAVLRDVLPMDDKEEEDYKAAMRALTLWELRLTDAVKVTT